MKNINDINTLILNYLRIDAIKDPHTRLIKLYHISAKLQELKKHITQDQRRTLHERILPIHTDYGKIFANEPTKTNKNPEAPLP
jgi:hypothetical protein